MSEDGPFGFLVSETHLYGEKQEKQLCYLQLRGSFGPSLETGPFVVAPFGETDPRTIRLGDILDWSNEIEHGMRNFYFEETTQSVVTADGVEQKAEAVKSERPAYDTVLHVADFVMAEKELARRMVLSCMKNPGALRYFLPSELATGPWSMFFDIHKKISGYKKGITIALKGSLEDLDNDLARFMNSGIPYVFTPVRNKNAVDTIVVQDVTGAFLHSTAPLPHRPEFTRETTLQEILALRKGA